ncbi:Long-chain-fatty-acid--CoA ligase FadD17 [Zhongshania aliphaticivorans]|uniref:Long-chain-fatty-acid--CoA ligase FadD17 n=1 Tax=Zhongshania aliphaticivorans TaxID=1470434 RepID=A0A5S9N8W2_9GAMM|nr:long-chain-acyl-CoA synthetase [Zhongshania aliphaticivorans]CAA0080477.1 Long-chain-fatty-acid--CoA ligase FadD17 [Zhongshania aliphaticivorans]CAA0085651.1 Long-chain-fatty-acid--CoA ligase FadD17 [Zhongshania aliphaticivorans]
MSEIIRVIKDLTSVLPAVMYRPPKDNEKKSLGLLFQNTAQRYAEKSAIIFEGRELSWGRFNALVNQFAHSFKKQGIARGDCVALLMENRIEMLACFFALAKLGAATGFINTSLQGRSLIHCISITESKKCIVGEELIDSIANVKDELSLKDKDYLWVKDDALSRDNADHQSVVPSWSVDLTADLAEMPTGNLAETADIRASERACYIFTSGTTGLPKAALILHRRYLAAAEPYSRIAFRAKQTDRLYLCLPLYHFTGLGPGVGTCLFSGASIFLRRRFSASQFWPETQKYQTTLFVYVGELCRYLAMQKTSSAEANNPIQTMVGNGLRPDVWEVFRQRFKIPRISEMYGSSEGNAIFINLLNKDKTIGTTSAKILLVKYDFDVDEMVRDKKGKLVEAAKGEPGVLLMKIDERFKFDGYQDKKASNSKVMTGVRKKGDRWFNTGDVIKQIDVGFALGLAHYEFVDRLGDTFRWRSENVSTNEVGEILNGNAQVEMANVYGVPIPQVEGRAGMAAITLKAGQHFDVDEFSQYVINEMPAYARPVFVRIQPAAETTVTFKLFKANLRKEAYDINTIDDVVYVLKPKSSCYEILDSDFYQAIVNGQHGY